jgi:hypothetical protein
MFFLVFYALALVTAGVRLAADRRPRTPGRMVEVLLQHLTVVAYGAGGVFAFVGHRFRADETARSIGWPAGNPFQQEVAFANLGHGVVALLAARGRGPFHSAVAIAASVFYLGAALIHLEELRRDGNVALNNAGGIAPDLLTPLTTLGLLLARERLGAGGSVPAQ